MRRFDRGQLCKQGETAHAGAFPDQVGDVDRRLTARRISQGRQDTLERERGERLTRQCTADALDDDIHAAASRDAGDAVSEILGREIDDMFKTKGARSLRFGRAGRS